MGLSQNGLYYESTRADTVRVYHVIEHPKYPGEYVVSWRCQTGTVEHYVGTTRSTYEAKTAQLHEMAVRSGWQYIADEDPRGWPVWATAGLDKESINA